MEFQAADLQTAVVFCTIANSGSEDSGEFTVEVLLGKSELATDDDAIVASTKINLAAGASRELRLEAVIPQEYAGKLAVMSIRLDHENSVDEGIFEGDNTVTKVLAPAALTMGTGKALSWNAVQGASSYDLEYAVEGNWDDSAVLRNITGNSINLDLAAGHYSFRVTPRDAEDKAIQSGMAEWNDTVIFSSTFRFFLDGGPNPVSTEQFVLMDGLYDWEKMDLGGFTGTLTLNQVDGIHRGLDAQKMSIQVLNGEVAAAFGSTKLLLDNGLYYFTAAGSRDAGTGSELSFAISGDIFSNNEPERNFVSLPDCVDGNGFYCETMNGWVGAFDGEDFWNFLLEDAGELNLSINNPEKLTGNLIVDLFVQSGANGQYQRVRTFSVDASSSGLLLDDFIVTNNFYVRVGARDNGKGEDNSDYSLCLDFMAFDSTSPDEDAWCISAGEQPIQVNGWVGYRKELDTYLLSVDSDCAGRYEFRLSGDAGEATLNIRSMSGKLIKSAALDEQGIAVISDFDLYCGDYLVEINSRNNVWIDNNTRYSLSVNRNKAFQLISETSFAEIQSAEQGEKLFYALDIPESGRYDLSELQNAGLSVWVQEADNNGNLKSAKLRPGWVNLDWDTPSYMTICNDHSAWTDTRIGLDGENHKFVLFTAAGQ